MEDILTTFVNVVFDASFIMVMNRDHDCCIIQQSHYIGFGPATKDDPQPFAYLGQPKKFCDKSATLCFTDLVNTVNNEIDGASVVNKRGQKVACGSEIALKVFHHRIANNSRELFISSSQLKDKGVGYRQR